MDIYNNIPIKLKQLQLQDEVKFGLIKKNDERLIKNHLN